MEHSCHVKRCAAAIIPEKHQVGSASNHFSYNLDLAAAACPVQCNCIEIISKRQIGALIQQRLKSIKVAFARLRRHLGFLARDALQRLDRKYAHLAQAEALRQALLRTREGLAQTGSDYLLGRFSYADIAMAVVLEVIAPIAQTHPPLGPATQSCWQDPALADEFKDLLDWRDRLAGTKDTSYSQFG